MNDLTCDMGGLKAEIKGDMNDLKAEIKADMEGLTKLLQEMFPNGEKVFHETHEEKKRKMNYDFIDSHIGFDTRHIPRLI